MDRAGLHRWVAWVERQCHVSANTAGREPVLVPEQGWPGPRWRKRRLQEFSDASRRPTLLDRVSEAFAGDDRGAALHRDDRARAGPFPPDPRALGRAGQTTIDRPRR